MYNKGEFHHIRRMIMHILYDLYETGIAILWANKDFLMLSCRDGDTQQMQGHKLKITV